jgi:hypothetical protein
VKKTAGPETVPTPAPLPPLSGRGVGGEGVLVRYLKLKKNYVIIIDSTPKIFFSLFLIVFIADGFLTSILKTAFLHQFLTPLKGSNQDKFEMPQYLILFHLHLQTYLPSLLLL